MFTSSKGPRVCNLNQPGSDRPFVRIENVAFPMDVKEHLLHDILSLGRISKDARSDFENQPGIAIEQKSQCFPIPTLDETHRGLVIELSSARLGTLVGGLNSGLTARKPGCDQSFESTR